jgi:hypothetical protein
VWYLTQNVDVKSNVVFDYNKAPKGDCANGLEKRFGTIGIFNHNRVLFDASYNQKTREKTKEKNQKRCQEIGGKR